MTSTNASTERPLDSVESERSLRGHFPYEDMSPEEFAARHASGILCFSLHERRYRDATFDAWIQRLAEILFDWNVVNACRKKYLTPEELQRQLERDQEEP
jgi:hypothetical protein